MNTIKKLSIEFEGIRSIITQYSGDGYVENILNQLQKGINSRDYETITFTMRGLVRWYEDNWRNISSNQFVHNLEEHQRNYRTLKDLLEQLTPEDCAQWEGPIPSDSAKDNAPEEGPIVFISHRSSDKKYGNALRNFLVGMGVKDHQIVYTSHPLNKIPLNQNIYAYLREHIRSDIFMIILWSDDYLESPACLNEMGAAWVVQSDYTNIYTPDFHFGNPKYHQCAVDTNKMGAVLNGDAHCRASMLELKNKVAELFNLQIDEQHTMYLIDQFIEAITSGKDE